MSTLRQRKIIRGLSGDRFLNTEGNCSDLSQIKIDGEIGKLVESQMLVTFTEKELEEFADLYVQDVAFLMSEESIKDNIRLFRSQATSELRENFLMSRRDHVLETILDRFMLGGLMAKGDRDGGPVDTVHNVRQGVYATEQAQQRYESRPEYNSHTYHSDRTYRHINGEAKRMKESGNLIDAYTGQRLSPEQNIDLDHVVAAHEIHNDPGRILAGLDGVALANSEVNLQATDRSINRAKGSLSMSDFINRVDSRKDLNMSETPISDVNRKLIEIDPQLAMDKDQAARESINREIRWNYYSSQNFLQNTGIQALKQGSSMAIRQFIAIYLKELVVAIFDETRDYLKTSARLSGVWYKDLSQRIERIFLRCRSKWSEALEALRAGGVSGFISSVSTVIINAFIKTSQNIVRIIREGIFTLVRAVKLLATNPKKLGNRELYHEVGKLMLSGISFSIGILLEEAIDKTPPMLAIRSIPVIGEHIADIVFVFMTALTNGLILYAWDRLDFFGANEDRIHERVMELLQQEHNDINKAHIDWIKGMSRTSPAYADYLRRECSSWLDQSHLNQLDLV
jgi:hypothetical protein